MFKNKYLLILFPFALIILTTGSFLPVVLEADVSGKISGRIVDEATGKGVEGIIIAINFERWQTLTDRDGFFKFEKVPDGHYKIRVLINKNPYYTKLYERDVRMEKGKDIALKDIVALRGGVIEGVIKRWDGKPAPYMSVTVYAKNENPGVYGGVPAKNGHYRVSKLPPDTDLKVVACCWYVARGCGRLVLEEIRAEKDKTTQFVNFTIPNNPTEIYGKVTDKDKEPLQAYLAFWKGTEDMGKILCDKDGTYSIRALEAGSYRAHVGYGCKEMKICGDREIYVEKGSKIKMDIIISENCIEFKECKMPIRNPLISISSISEINKKRSLAELKFARNEGFDERLRDMILDAYINDVLIKANSMCLPDSNPQSIRIKMLNRLGDANNPIYVFIKKKDRTRITRYRLQRYEVKTCGETLRGSNVIYFYPAAFTEKCSSLASIIFHELLHIVDVRDDMAYIYTKRCYEDEALEQPWRLEKRNP